MSTELRHIMCLMNCELDVFISCNNELMVVMVVYLPTIGDPFKPLMQSF